LSNERWEELSGREAQEAPQSRGRGTGDHHRG
jgi:hypothetical protein